ncbi:MAG TPA: hydrogenase maturation nickel metallochaperone HypA [Acidobacteriota bacterium]|nr:hydrogenase maturation nickel metallochaperone HypA [Acidobacteriota bacterium]
MHELSIMQDLFRQLEGLANEHGARRVLSLEVEVGEFSNVVPELLQQAFLAFRQAEPLLSGASLHIRSLSLRLRCRGCGHEFSPPRLAFRCVRCGAGRVETLQGEELLLRNVELEVPQAQEVAS